MRISAIDVGNIVKTLDEFDNTNTFIMREVPQMTWRIIRKSDRYLRKRQ